MEVDSEQISNARQFIPYFDLSNNFAWRERRPGQIERRRALLGDVLIFDLLLSSGGIKHPDALYPPTDVPALEHLLEVIEASHYDALKKECLVYYLLKWHHDGREERFQTERCIPPHFAAAADAYWLLDTGLNVPHAISLLSDARINQEYTSKVLQAASLVPNPSPLIVKYVRTARSALTDPHDLETYIIALAEASSFCDAWEYQRIFNDVSPMRSRLFKKLLDWTVTPKSKPMALKQLLFLPLSQFEESLLRSQALESSLPPSALAVLQDLVCVRLVQAGRYIEAIKIDHEFSASTSSKLKGLTMERTKMIQDLHSILPAAERILLDEELKPADKQKPSSSENLTTKKPGGDISMSSSWEDVRILRSPSPSHRLGNLKSLSRDSQPLSRSLTERVQAPRFGTAIPQKSSAQKQPPLIATSALSVSPTAPRPVSRKSFPLPFIPPASVAPRPAGRPRYSAGLLPPSSTLEAPKASSVSQRPSPEWHAVTANGASETSAFLSANKSKNAFFGPSGKPNGLVDHNPPENHVEEAEEARPRSSAREDINMEMADLNEEHKHVDTEEKAPKLQYSVFGNNASPQRTPIAAPNGQYSSSPEQGKKRKGVPPGAFLSDEDDAPEDEHENAHWQNSRASPATGSSTSPVSPKKWEPTPERKSTRSKQSVPREVKQLKRSLPGALIDEDDEEEDDYLAPLRQPSPPRRPLRKGRSSMSSDLGDEHEAPQTRRRSSRLSSQVNTTSLDMSPKKSSASTRTRKSTKSTSSTKRKR